MSPVWIYFQQLFWMAQTAAAYAYSWQPPSTLILITFESSSISKECEVDFTDPMEALRDK